MISGETRLVGLLGDPVSQSLSPLMQNAAFAARGLDWAYLPLLVTSERLDDAVRGLVALGFAGANVTTPHKLAVAKLVETDEQSVNTLVVRDGRVVGLLDGRSHPGELEFQRAAIIGDGGAAARLRRGPARRGALLTQGDLAARRVGRRPRRQRHLRARRGPRRARPWADPRRSPVSAAPRRRARPRPPARACSTGSTCSSRRAPPPSSSGPACPLRSTSCARRS